MNALKPLYKTLNILIYPYVYSYIQKELLRISQYRADLVEFYGNKITEDEINIKTGDFYKNDTIIYILSVVVIVVLFVQGVVLLYCINKSYNNNRIMYSIIVIFTLIISMLLPFAAIYYKFANSSDFGKTMKETFINNYNVSNFWKYLITSVMIANVCYSTIYNMFFYINIEKHI